MAVWTVNSSKLRNKTSECSSVKSSRGMQLLWTPKLLLENLTQCLCKSYPKWSSDWYLNISYISSKSKAMYGLIIQLTTLFFAQSQCVSCLCMELFSCVCKNSAYRRIPVALWGLGLKIVWTVPQNVTSRNEIVFSYLFSLHNLKHKPLSPLERWSG